MTSLSANAIASSAQRLYPSTLTEKARTAAGLEEVVGRVAVDLNATAPADLAAIRAALVDAVTAAIVIRGRAAQKVSGGADAAAIAPRATQNTGVSAVDVRAPGAPAAVVNAVVPLLEKGKLSDKQLTAGLARIHNAWFEQAKKDGYLLGERDKADPVMKMARSFFVPVEVKGGALALKLAPGQDAFVCAYGRKQQPGVVLDDAAAFAAGSAKILSEIKANNQAALEDSMKLVTAHLVGDIARLGAGDYLDAVKKLKGVEVPKLRPSIAPPSTEKAMATLEQRLTDLSAVVHLLNGAGDAPVHRTDVPKSLHAAYDLLDEEHHRWVHTQLGYGSTANPDFIPTTELAGKRLALDAAPMRGAYETLLAGLRAGTITPAALNAILPLLDKGQLTPEQLTAGLALIHNDWYAKAKADGYVLGERDKNDPILKNARSFFVQVEAKGGALALKLDEREATFVRSYGRKQEPTSVLNDAQALDAGAKKIVGEIEKNNSGALAETMKLVTGHLAGDVVRLGKDGYLDEVKALGPVELAPATADAASTAQAHHVVTKMLDGVDRFIAFLETKKASGDPTVSRDETPPDLRVAYDLFAEEHDRWLAQQIGWGAAPNADWVHTSELKASRILLDAAPIRGALLTLQGALDG